MVQACIGGCQPSSVDVTLDGSAPWSAADATLDTLGSNTPFTAAGSRQRFTVSPCVTDVSPMCHRCVTNVSQMCHRCVTRCRLGVTRVSRVSQRCHRNLLCIAVSRCVTCVSQMCHQCVTCVTNVSWCVTDVSRMCHGCVTDVSQMCHRCVTECHQGVTRVTASSTTLRHVDMLT